MEKASRRFHVEKRKNSVSQEPVQNEEGESFTGCHCCGLLRTHCQHEGNRPALGFSLVWAAKEAAQGMGQIDVSGNNLIEFKNPKDAPRCFLPSHKGHG